MDDIGIAPPSPPKIEKKEQSPKEELLSVSVKPEKKGLFKKMFSRQSSDKKTEDKSSEVSAKQKQPKKDDLGIDEFDLDKLRSEFGIPPKQQKSEISELQNEKVLKGEKKVDDLVVPKAYMEPSKPKKEIPKKKVKKTETKVSEFQKKSEKAKPKSVKEKEEVIDETDVSRSGTIEDIDWSGGDLVDEIHDSKEVSGWDSDEPVHIEKILKSKTEIKISESQKKSEKPKVLKPKIKTVEKLTPKVAKKAKVKPVRKTKQESVKKTMPRKISKTGKVDRVIEEYFKSVEQEQKLIQKELDMIVVHPKKALQKGPNEYIIHHNEKLIRSMKELLAALKSIEDEEFTRNVGANKKQFYSWVKGILENEKKAEQQRNKLLKQKMKEMFKEYGAGINKDILDKKYELSSQKKENDKKLKQALIISERMRVKEADLKKKDKELNNLIEEGIKKTIDKRLKKEQISLKRSETIAGNKAKGYDSKAEVLRSEKEDFNKHKAESLQLLDEGDELKRLKVSLERKDVRLKSFNEKLKEYEKELNDKIIDFKSLEKEAKAVLKREGTLASKEKELELEIRAFETEKKSFELRRHEVVEMEGHVEKERGDLKEIKSSLMFTENEAKEKLEEVKEIQHEIEIEEKQFREKKHSFGFDEYLHTVSLEEEEPIVLIDKTVEDFLGQINNCRSMVRNNQLDDAKKAYSELRAKFSQTKIEPNKKEALYNSIRELYDDIYLEVISGM